MKRVRLPIKRMPNIVPPVQRDHVPRQFGDQLRFVENDVAPEHHLSATLFHCAIDLQEEVQIDPLLAALLHFGFASAQTQIKRLIASDVEKPAGKVGKELVV